MRNNVVGWFSLPHEGEVCSQVGDMTIKKMAEGSPSPYLDAVRINIAWT